MLPAYFPGGTKGKTKAAHRFAFLEIRIKMKGVYFLGLKQPLSFLMKNIRFLQIYFVFSSEQEFISGSVYFRLLLKVNLGKPSEENTGLFGNFFPNSLFWEHPVQNKLAKLR